MLLRSILIIGLFSSIHFAFAAETQITWLGHAAFSVKTPKGKVLMIDPWLKNPLNPAAKNGKDPLSAINKVDYILITHGHFDHVGDSVQLAKKTGAKLVSNFELGNNLSILQGFPKNQMGFDSLMNIGGEIPIADNEVSVFMTPAIHSSGLDDPKPGHPVAYGGNPAGFVIKIKEGPTIYHSGDTAYFSDMELIGETHAPDIALVNIGGHFGMSPEMAAKALKAVKAKRGIPHHYKTFPILTQDPASFVQEAKKFDIPVTVMEPGMTLKFEGKDLKSAGK